MCSYLTSTTPLEGSSKGANGWFRLGSALVYFDHPYHSPAEHTLNIDFLNEAEGPGARVAVELTAESARALVDCIEEALAAAGPLAGPRLGEKGAI
ncbi:MAG TPA: DUF6295 family protein [Acidimicrobiales bacterium]|nr:DUF6295 family protein [Acidimicrobiales bacterium]